MINAIRYALVVCVCLMLPSLSIASDVTKRLELLRENGVWFYSKYGADTADTQWQLMVHGENSFTDVLSVTNLETGELIYSMTHERLGTDKFVELDVISVLEYENPVLAVTWTRGVHGEQIYLIDPAISNGDVLAYFTSFWPISYSIDGLQITFELSDGKSQRKRSVWLKK